MKMKARAIVAGLLVDVGGSVVVGIVLGVVVAIIAVVNVGPSAETLGALRSNVWVKAIGLVGTTFFTGLGGYVAARLSKPNGMKNAVAVGVLSLLLGIVLAVLLPGITPRWKLIAGLIITIPAAFAGGRLSTRGAQQTAPDDAETRARAP
jgi:MFS family permease